MNQFSKQNRETFWKYKKIGGGRGPLGPLGPSPKSAYDGHLLSNRWSRGTKTLGTRLHFSRSKCSFAWECIQITRSTGYGESSIYRGLQVYHRLAYKKPIYLISFVMLSQFPRNILLVRKHFHLQISSISRSKRSKRVLFLSTDGTAKMIQFTYPTSNASNTCLEFY